MTDLQFYVLVAIPLVGILCNTALFIHVSSRVDHMGDRIDALANRLDADIKAVNAALTSLEADVAVLKDRAKL